MPISEAFRAQVRLLVRTLPIVAEERDFALKGGTAINLFVRDMPRLSVDIDLAYLPIEDRATSLAAIEAALTRVQTKLVRDLGARVAPVRSSAAQELTKLLVSSADATIKIEVTPVLRGSVFASEFSAVRPRVEEEYGFAEMQIASFADLYGGKIVAALDRQHPRDLFDVRDLLRNEGIDDALRQAFAVYLISHRRPMAELLSVRPKDIAMEFERGFVGMTDEPVTLEELVAARADLKALIVDAMPVPHRQLLVSVEEGAPDWTLLGLPGAADLPSVKWRLQNIRGLDAAKREVNVTALKGVLGL